MSKHDGWVARDFDGELFFYQELPSRLLDGLRGWWEDFGGEYFALSNNHPVYKDLTWQDEPQPVYFSLTPPQASPHEIPVNTGRGRK